MLRVELQAEAGIPVAQGWGPWDLLVVTPGTQEKGEKQFNQRGGEGGHDGAPGEDSGGGEGGGV